MTKACLGNELESFQKSPMDLFILLNSIFRCSSNVNLTSKITRRCFGELIWETLLLLKSKEGCVAFFSFLVNIISWASLLPSRLKVILYWKTQSLIFFQVTVQLNSRWIYIVYNWKWRSIIGKKFRIWW